MSDDSKTFSLFVKVSLPPGLEQCLEDFTSEVLKRKPINLKIFAQQHFDQRVRDTGGCPCTNQESKNTHSESKNKRRKYRSIDNTGIKSRDQQDVIKKPTSAAKMRRPSHGVYGRKLSHRQTKPLGIVDTGSSSPNHLKQNGTRMKAKEYKKALRNNSSKNKSSLGKTMAFGIAGTAAAAGVAGGVGYIAGQDSEETNPEHKSSELQPQEIFTDENKENSEMEEQNNDDEENTVDDAKNDEDAEAKSMKAAEEESADQEENPETEAAEQEFPGKDLADEDEYLQGIVNLFVEQNDLAEKGADQEENLETEAAEEEFPDSGELLDGDEYLQGIDTLFFEENLAEKGYDEEAAGLGENAKSDKTSLIHQQPSNETPIVEKELTTKEAADTEDELVSNKEPPAGEDATDEENAATEEDAEIHEDSEEERAHGDKEPQAVRSASPSDNSSKQKDDARVRTLNELEPTDHDPQTEADFSSHKDNTVLNTPRTQEEPEDATVLDAEEEQEDSDEEALSDYEEIDDDEPPKRKKKHKKKKKKWSHKV